MLKLFFFKKIQTFLKKKLIYPIFINKGALNKISLGFAIGFFWGLTPTIGIQMYIVSLQWLLQKRIKKINFSLPIAVGVTYISNPLTFFPLYLIFYKTGQLLLSLVGFSDSSNFEQFVLKFNLIYTASDIFFLEKIYLFLKIFVGNLGIPLFIGSLAYAIPVSIMSYYLSETFIKYLKYRRMKNKLKKKNLRKQNV